MKLLIYCAILSTSAAGLVGHRSTSAGFMERVAQLTSWAEEPNSPPHGLLLWSTKRDTSSSTVLEPRLPAGYEHHPGFGYYKMHDFGAPWCLANQICTEEGARLLVLNSEAEAEIAKKLMAKYPTITGGVDNVWAWIGLHEKGRHGQFFTIHGEPLESTGFTRWEANYPNKPAPNDCLLIHRSTAGLADDNCAPARAFICEHPDVRI